MSASSVGFGMAGLLIFIILVLGAAVGLAFIPANIAKKKGYSFGGFFVLGFFFFFIGLIVALCLDDKNAQMNQMQAAVYSANYSNRTASASVADELQKISDLFQRGAISQEEYDQLKAKLINNSNPDQTRKCPTCGEPQYDSSRFCRKCGTKL